MHFKISHGKVIKRKVIGKNKPCAFRRRNYISFLLSLDCRGVLTSPCVYCISSLSCAGELLSSVTTHLRCAFASLGRTVVL